MAQHCVEQNKTQMPPVTTICVLIRRLFAGDIDWPALTLNERPAIPIVEQLVKAGYT